MTPKQQMLELVRGLRTKKNEKTLIYKIIPSVSKGEKGKNHQLPPSNDDHKRGQ